MITRAIDSSGDWTFGKGKSDYRRNQEALKQDIKTKINEWVGDCFFNQNAGIDWQNRLAAGNQESRLEEELTNLILKIDGVINVISLSATRVDRKFSVNYQIETIYSQNAQRIIEENQTTVGI